MPGSLRGMLPQVGYPVSRAQLARTGGLKTFLDFFAFRDVVFHLDDFDGDTANLDYYAQANSGGAGAANLAINVQANGVARMTSGTTDNGSVSAIGPAIYAGDNYAGMEARVKIDTITNSKWEVGLIDAVPASNTGAANDIDGAIPTSFAVDYAVAVQDTDETFQSARIITDGTAIAAQGFSVADTAVPTAATYFTVRVQCLGSSNKVAAWVNGNLVTIIGSLEGGTLLAPWLFVQSRTTSTRNFDVDYLAVWADRA